MARRVDADAGIAVFIPCTADLGILLDDDMLVARLFQLERSREARHARADDQHLEACLRRRTAFDFLARLGQLETDLVEEQRQEFVGDFLTHADAHHPLHQLFGRIIFPRGPRRRQDMQQLRPQFLRIFVRYLGPGNREWRLDIVAEDIQHHRIVREMHIDHQQRVDIRAIQRFPQLIAVRQRQAAVVPISRYYRGFCMFDHL